jgi:hypothetical protein
MREKDLKAIVHGALALLAIAEAFTCKSKTRKLVTGLCAGWHLHALFYHVFLEKEKLDSTDSKS